MNTLALLQVNRNWFLVSTYFPHVRSEVRLDVDMLTQACLVKSEMLCGIRNTTEYIGLSLGEIHKIMLCKVREMWSIS